MPVETAWRDTFAAKRQVIPDPLFWGLSPSEPHFAARRHTLQRNPLVLLSLGGHTRAAKRYINSIPLTGFASKTGPNLTQSSFQLNHTYSIMIA